MGATWRGGPLRHSGGSFIHSFIPAHNLHIGSSKPHGSFDAVPHTQTEAWGVHGNDQNCGPFRAVYKEKLLDFSDLSCSRWPVYAMLKSAKSHFVHDMVIGAKEKWGGGQKGEFGCYIRKVSKVSLDL